MKNLLFILPFLVLISSCGDRNNDYIIGPGYPTVFSKSYIQKFVDVEQIGVQPLWGIKIDEVNKSVGAGGHVVEEGKVYSIDKGICLHLYMLGNSYTPSSVPQAERFNELIEAIPDKSFNTKVAMTGYVPNSITTTLTSITITSDKDFSAEYPAGSDLSPLFIAYFDNPMEIITNNYRAKEGAYRFSTTKKELPQHVTKGEVSQMLNKPYIGFMTFLVLKEAPLQTGDYSFEVTITTREGVEIKQKSVEFGIAGQ